MADLQIEENKLMALFWDMKKVKIVMNFRHKLTPTGFEVYIAKFFEKYSDFKTLQNGWYSDGWIDVKGIRLNQLWEKEYLIVQCKKWSTFETGENDIAKFYGKVVHKKIDYPNTHLVFATTNKGNLRARKFCEEKKIVFTDCTDLITMQETYSLNEFCTFIYSGNEYRPEKIFPKAFTKILEEKYLQLSRETILIKMKTNKDIFTLLKEVRKDLAKKEELPLHCIFSNKTLSAMCEAMPRTLHSLKLIHGIKETKAEKYGERILEAINSL